MQKLQELEVKIIASTANVKVTNVGSNVAASPTPRTILTV
jgi:hypothetical protein